ncbi:MAG: dienelactone hydrolase family protein [Cellvibrionaceae bacterium]|nr:dienelactone hydrolase family protein [Cellvibrionaceae bacterium]
MPQLKYIEVSTNPKPDASIIWLHGLGASGYDFEPIVSELNIPKTIGLRFIFPHAPNLPVTINGGMLMPAWYDILAMDIDRSIDSKQLTTSANAVADLIDKEIARAIPSSRIFIAGFSQGGAVGYEVALSYPQPLGGLIALSTYFASKDSITFSQANQGIPIFIAHGKQDAIVPEALGQQANSVLKKRGYKTSYYTYPMEHSVCAKEVNHIRQWLQTRLGW